MPSSDSWLANQWPFVKRHLPPAPSTVLEIGCGPKGGFVPALIDAGYRATGIDPAAPEAPSYERIPFEAFDPAEPADVIVASASLHHVDDLDKLVDHIERALTPGGTLIVIEWAWERFDEATARWCFARLPRALQDDERTWLHRHRDNWMASGTSWERYLTDWTSEHRLHRAGTIVDKLAGRFETHLLADAPYFFSALEHTSEAQEQAAIDAKLIRATGVRLVATGVNRS